MYDFIGFTYNGKHSYTNFKVYRISEGDRYNDNLIPQINDKVTDVVGSDGQYYFGTNYKTRQFPVSIAFEKLTETQYREMRQWLCGDGIHDLIFDELPYKVYSAKVTGTPQLKTLCFDEDGVRVYKGEGTIQFTCYYPFAHTPVKNFDGREISNYNDSNIDEWIESSGIGNYEIGQNNGDLPAPFVVESLEAKKDDKFKIGELEIIIKEACNNLKWDSKTGLVIGKINETTRPIRYEGTSYGTIPVGGISKTNISYESNNILINANKEKYIDGIKQEENANLPFLIKYSYWYY